MSSPSFTTTIEVDQSPEQAFDAAPSSTAA